MNRNGLNSVVGVLALVALVVVLAVVVYSYSSSFIINLSPPTDEKCRELVYEIETYYEGSDLFLAIVNKGNVPIGGGNVYVLEEGGSTELGAYEFDIFPGETESTPISEVGEFVYNKNNPPELNFIPRILVEEGTNVYRFACPNEFSKKLPIKPGQKGTFRFK